MTRITLHHGLVFVAALILASAAWGQTNFTPIADNTIFSNDTDGSNGAGSRLFIGTTSGSANPGSQRRALLLFDVSSIPPGSTIDNATLTLTQVSAIPPAPAISTVAAHRLLVAFGEGGATATGGGLGIPAAAIPPDATWVNRITSGNSTTGTAWGAGGGLAGADFVAVATSVDPDGSGTAVLTVTTDVQAWVNGSSNFGWILLGSTTNGSVRGYGSRENATVASRPVLSVNFTPPPNLSITKSDLVDPVLPSGTIDYTITVANASGAAAAGTVTVVDTLPPGVTFTLGDATGLGWTCSETVDDVTVTCTRASLGGGASAPAINLAVTAPNSGSGIPLTNTATVSTSGEVDTTDNTATQETTVAAGADLQITKTESADPTEIGTTLTYTLNVINAGPDTATNVTVTDTLPTGFSAMVSNNGGFSCGQASGVITCTLASFAPGSTSIIFSGTAPSTPTTLTNMADISSAATLDPNTGNNSASITTDIVSQATLSVTKSVWSPDGGFLPGSDVVYTVIITNNGPHAQLDNAGDEFTDILPASLENVSASILSGGGTLGGIGNTVTWNGSIPANLTVVIEISATIVDTASVGDAISNQATVNFDPNGDGTSESNATSDDPDTGAANDPTVFVIAGAVLEIPTASTAALLLLIAMLGGAATVMLRR